MGNLSGADRAQIESESRLDNYYLMGPPRDPAVAHTDSILPSGKNPDYVVHFVQRHDEELDAIQRTVGACDIHRCSMTVRHCHVDDGATSSSSDTESERHRHKGARRRS